MAEIYSTMTSRYIYIAINQYNLLMIKIKLKNSYASLSLFTLTTLKVN